MAIKTVFTDGEQEMECYLNDKGKVFINITTRGEDPIYNGGFITLDKQDVIGLITLLEELKEDVTSE